MTPKYYSKEWMDEVQNTLANNSDYLAKAKSLTFKSQYLVTDCPGGVDKLVNWNLVEGRLVDYSIEGKPAPSEWRTSPTDGKTFFMKITGSYKTFQKLNRSELTAIQAVMKKVYKIEGSMAQIMAKMGPIQAMANVMATVPVEYEEV